MIPSIYINVFILVSWVIYIANSFYQNKKMGQFFPNKKADALTIPFYFFSLICLWIVTQNLVDNFYSSSIINLELTISRTMGICFLSVATILFIYLNFFEKSFPSCATVRDKQELSGIYNYVRHPSHYVIFFITFGSALILDSIFLLFFAVVNHYFIYYYYIIEEELIKKTNSDYQIFLNKTNRFLPYFNINK